MKYILLSTILIIGISTTSFGQKLDHRLGEIIVELEEGKELTSMTRELSTFRGKKTKIKIEQITREPFNLWKVCIDANKINKVIPYFLTILF